MSRVELPGDGNHCSRMGITNGNKEFIIIMEGKITVVLVVT